MMPLCPNNGPEFTNTEFTCWCKGKGISICYIQPRRPAALTAPSPAACPKLVKVNFRLCCGACCLRVGLLWLEQPVHSLRLRGEVPQLHWQVKLLPEFLGELGGFLLALGVSGADTCQLLQAGAS